MRCGAILCGLLALLGCTSGARGTTAASPPPSSVSPPRQASAMLEVPVPTQDVVLQLFCRSTGRLERFERDGRWMVTEPGGAATALRPNSYYGGSGDRLGADALRRIRESMTAVGFFQLPALIQGNLPPKPSEVFLMGGQGALNPLRYALSAFSPEGKLHVVEIDAELRSLETFGPLLPLVTELDREAWGNWRLE